MSTFHLLVAAAGRSEPTNRRQTLEGGSGVPDGRAPRRRRRRHYRPAGRKAVAAERRRPRAVTAPTTASPTAGLGGDGGAAWSGWTAKEWLGGEGAAGQVAMVGGGRGDAIGAM